MQEQNRFLILEDGHVFRGTAFGSSEDVVGELAFSTSMSGYLEAFTDPGNFGRIVIQTFPLVGDYGIIPEDAQSDRTYMRALIVREWCQVPSNFRSQMDIDTYMKQEHIVGLCDVDTRALTRIVRQSGTMRAKITDHYTESEKESVLAQLRSYKPENAVMQVTCREITKTENQGKKTVVVWDLGIKKQLRQELLNRHCTVITVPATTTAAEISAFRPDGVLIAGGPGAPEENPAIVDEISILCQSGVPVFAIGLGHLLVALSQGAKVEALKVGHRGENQPVKDVKTGRVYITCQNHGYVVASDTLGTQAEMCYVNANDGTCEGIQYLDKPVFSVQFHPEAAGGPLDMEFLFDRFMSMMGE